MLITLGPYFGYLASLMLILALLTKSDLKFRYFNIAGNLLFIIYALIFEAYPVLLTNVILLAINGYYCYKLLRVKESFELMEMQGNEKLLHRFLEFYDQDIKAYFPNFEQGQLPGNFNFVVLRNLVIANIFSAAIDPTGKAIVLINYTVPKYRDYKIGTFIFEREKEFLLANSIQTIFYPVVHNRNHAIFLKKMRFEKTELGSYSRSL